MNHLLRAARHDARADGSPRGQSMVEMALILPFLAMLIIGTLEFGYVFDHHLTLEYASREGARTGAAIVNGGGPLGCGAGQSPNWTTVDPQIIAAAQRVLDSPGSAVELANVTQIRIFRSGADGQELGPVNRWTYTPGAGPVVDGEALDFSPVSVTWQACSRTNASSPDSLGVSVSYQYFYQTVFTNLIGMSQLDMRDQTVMQLNPTDN